MKKYLLPFALIALFSLSGCKLVDKAKTQYEKYKNEYEEIREGIKRGPKPPALENQGFQSDTDLKQGLISSSCASNQDVKHIYFATQADASNNIFNAIKNLYSYPYNGVLKPFWDIRYTNPVSNYVHHNDGSTYADHAKLTGLDARSGVRNVITGTAASQTDIAGTVIQSKCINGTLVAGTTANLNDSPTQSLVYGGIATTFIYQLHADNHIHPWSKDKSGNLMMQAYFDTPIYHNYENNIGGSISYALYMYNPKLKKHLSYIITMYAYGVAWQKEKAGIRFDPTTNILHVATVIKDSSWWCTKSPKSNAIEEVFNKPNKTTKDDGKWNNFYRANISYQNLLAVLNELKTNPPASVAGQDFGLTPEDWELTFIAIQYEVEEQGGKASISGSFKGFEAYISTLPL